jgi:hypothetical protein
MRTYFGSGLIQKEAEMDPEISHNFLSSYTLRGRASLILIYDPCVRQRQSVVRFDAALRISCVVQACWFPQAEQSVLLPEKAPPALTTSGGAQCIQGISNRSR